jgi:hypothetical protein
MGELKTLDLMGLARRSFKELSVSFHVMSMETEGMLLVSASVVTDLGAVTMFEPVERTPTLLDMRVRQARDSTLNQALELVTSGIEGYVYEPEAMEVEAEAPTASPIISGEKTILSVGGPGLPPEEVEDGEGPRCDDCGTLIKPYNSGGHPVSIEKVMDFTIDRWGAQLCVDCSNKRNRERNKGV